MQALDEELKIEGKTTASIESMFIVRAQQGKSLTHRFHAWWDNYLKNNDSSITDLFYGYSITVCECPVCHCSTYSMSPFNTLYTCLLLTHIRVSVHLVYQHWNSQMLSLQETFVKDSFILSPGSKVGAIRDECMKKLNQSQLTCYCVCYTNSNGEEKVCIKLCFYCGKKWSNS